MGWPDAYLLSPYMRDLVEVGLVQQVFAPMHLADVHAFSEAFVHLVESRLAHLHAHPTAQRTLVHIEKLGPIASYLEQQDLAQATDYPWFSVDDRVASWFMTYLAVILGASDTLDAAPITNRLEYASLLGGSPRLFDRPAAPLHRQKARNVLLLELLPVPDVVHIAPYELARFKDDHKASLRRMRTVVEAECGKIARIEDAEARREATEAFVAQSRSELGDIVDAMAGRWNIVNFCSLFTLGAAGITAATTDLPAGRRGN